MLQHLHGYLIVTLVGASALAFIPACRQEAPRGAVAASTLGEVREGVFRVDGMTCASCNVTVKIAAEKVRGVKSARADSDQGRAWVSFDPAVTTPAVIAAAISETGYEATPLDGPVTAGTSSTAQEAAVPPEVSCRVMREGVYRLWPELGRAPRPREIATALRMDEREVNRILDAIDGHWSPCGSIERADKSDRIVFAWPLSNVPTEYLVTIQGSKPVYGRCAIDALGMSAMYGRPVEIAATSVASDVAIRITVNGDRVERAEPADAVVWVAGEDCGCDEMALFANRAELEAWRRALDKPEGNTLTLAEATKYGVEVFGSRLTPPGP